MIQNVWLIPAFPLAAFLINGVFGRRWLHRWTGIVASVAVGLSALIAIGVFLEVLGGHKRTTVALYEWIGVGDFHINVAAFIDPLSSVMLLVAPIGIVVAIVGFRGFSDSATAGAKGGDLIPLATSVFRDFAFPFEVASVLLLAAMVGAIVLVKRDEE